MNILHIDASASDADTSHSRRLSAAVVRQLDRNGEATVTRRDVAADPLAHVDMTIRQAWLPDDQRDPAHSDLRRRSGELVDELKAADTIVIGAPMYNFTVPSTLKSWIDHICIAGQTFRYGESGPVGLLTGKRAVLALSSGGVYSEGAAAGLEFLDSYLRGVLGFLGVTDVTTVRAEGTSMGPEQEAEAMAEATGRIEALEAA